MASCKMQAAEHLRVAQDELVAECVGGVSSSAAMRSTSAARMASRAAMTMRQPGAQCTMNQTWKTASVGAGNALPRKLDQRTRCQTQRAVKARVCAQHQNAPMPRRQGILIPSHMPELTTRLNEDHRRLCE